MPEQIELPFQPPEVDTGVELFEPINPVYCPDGFAQPIDNTPCPVCGASYPREECKGLASRLA